MTFACLGGGLFALAGLLFNGEAAISVNSIFQFDPTHGFWFLNFGRNLFFPHEAYYHFLVVWILRLILKQQWKWVIGVTILLAACTPITGVEIICFLGLYFFLERIYFANPRMPWRFGAAAAILLICDLVYYMVWLPTFKEHALLLKQWTLDWNLDALPMLLAYPLVGAMVAFTQRRFDRTRVQLAKPYQRMFLCLFLTAFLLANHEAFFEAHQPIHFTRGYIWTPLFFMGVPGMKLLLRLIRRAPVSRLARIDGVALLSFILLLDNTLWLALRPVKTSDTDFMGISQGDFQALQWLKSHATRETLLLHGDYYFTTLAPAYMDISPWYGHPANTPDSRSRLWEMAELILEGKVLPYWRMRPSILALRPEEEARFLQKYQKRYHEVPHLLYRCETMAFYGL